MRVPLLVRRRRPDGCPRPERFDVEVPETVTVLDAIEIAWARHDRSLMFRHACHHGSCGSCAILVQGRERLPCVTAIADVWNGRGDLRVAPLRNLPLVADLVVDVSALLLQMAASGMSLTRQAERRIQGDGPIEELPAVPGPRGRRLDGLNRNRPAQHGEGWSPKRSIVRPRAGPQRR